VSPTNGSVVFAEGIAGSLVSVSTGRASIGRASITGASIAGASIAGASIAGASIGRASRAPKVNSTRGSIGRALWALLNRSNSAMCRK
jgi:hypothetical protein